MKIFSDTQFSDLALGLLEHEVAALGHDLIFPHELSTSVLAQGPDDPSFADAEIAFGQPDVKSVLGNPKLQWVHLTSAGFTRYDTPKFRAAAQARGLILTNSSTVYAEACAEHVFAFMLAQCRQLPWALNSRAANGTEEWLRLRNAAPLLRDQQVLILGYGAIATRLAAMLKPFECPVVAVRRHPRGDEVVQTIGLDQLDGALQTADHVVNILPENEGSRGFFSAARFAAMKEGAVFYNIGRGATVDQDALAAALGSGDLAAAWLDVTTPEPLPDDHPLRGLSNCYITPHTAGGQRAESEALVVHFLGNLRRFTAGEPLLDRVM